VSDVTCLCTAPLVAEVRARGLEAERLVDGLGIALAEVENPRSRIPWDPFTVFAGRAADLLGGPEQIEEIAARSAGAAVPAFLRRLLPHLASARPVYLIGARWWGPWVFRGTRATCEELADGRLREVIEILPGYAECPLFFQGIRGVLRAMPLLFGQTEAVVELAHDGRRGEFVISPPPPKRRLRNLFHRRRDLGALAGELEELGFGQEQLRESERRSRLAGALLADQSRRLETLSQLGDELSRRREEGELARALVRVVEVQFRASGVRLSGVGRDGEGFAQLAASGEVRGAPTATFALRLAERTVGRLELWGLPDDDARLRELLPWIAVLLESERSESAIRSLTRWLERDLADWSRVEHRLERVLRGHRVRSRRPRGEIRGDPAGQI
jgi:hypothetical protein